MRNSPHPVTAAAVMNAPATRRAGRVSGSLGKLHAKSHTPSANIDSGRSTASAATMMPAGPVMPAKNGSTNEAAIVR